MREIVIPKDFRSEASMKKLAVVRDRLVRLLAPQHYWLFKQKDALRFCEDVHNHVLAMDVMTT